MDKLSSLDGMVEWYHHRCREQQKRNLDANRFVEVRTKLTLGDDKSSVENSCAEQEPQHYQQLQSQWLWPAAAHARDERCDSLMKKSRKAPQQQFSPTSRNCDGGDPADDNLKSNSGSNAAPSSKIEVVSGTVEKVALVFERRPQSSRL